MKDSLKYGLSEDFRVSDSFFLICLSLCISVNLTAESILDNNNGITTLISSLMESKNILVFLFYYLLVAFDTHN